MDPFSLSSLFKTVKHERLNRKIWLPIEYILGLKKLSNLYQEIESETTSENFTSTVLEKLNINYEIVNPMMTLPKKEPLIIVSNHPFGALEALILLNHFSKHHTHVKVMANIFLQRITTISEHLFGVIPFKDNQAKKSNHKVMRDIYRWLQAGKCLITFPAGNVAHLQFKKACVADPNWDLQIAHLARATNALVLPIHIEGRNSYWFYLLGPKLHAFRYGAELLNKQDKNIRVHIGSIITPEQTKYIQNDLDLVNYFRLKSDQLPLNVKKEQ